MLSARDRRLLPNGRRFQGMRSLPEPAYAGYIRATLMREATKVLVPVLYCPTATRR